LKIPKPDEVSPRLSQLRTKQSTLQVEATAKRAEAAIIRARIQNAPSNGNAAENRVRAILGEAPIPDSAPDMPRLQTLLLELQDMNSAIGILDGAIQEEKRNASRLVCDSVKPEVDRLGKKFATAYLDLYNANCEYSNFLDQVENTGASISSLGRVWPASLGSCRDRSGPFHYTMREFVDAGYLSKSEVPEAVR
jgi:hypothetical protein